MVVASPHKGGKENKLEAVRIKVKMCGNSNSGEVHYGGDALCGSHVGYQRCASWLSQGRVVSAQFQAKNAHKLKFPLHCKNGLFHAVLFHCSNGT